MGGSIRRCEYYERHGKGRIFGGQTGPVGVLLILQLRGRSAEVVGEIFLDVGDAKLVKELFGLTVDAA